VRQDIILVVCDDEFHANGVEVIFKLFPIKATLFVLVKLLETSERLSLQLLVDHTFLELHRYFYKLREFIIKNGQTKAH